MGIHRQTQNSKFEEMFSTSNLITARVRGLSEDGKGIVHHPSGKVYFAAGVWPGDLAQFCVVGEKRKYGLARLEKLLEPAVGRKKPVCPHHGFDEGKCGGCPWQFVDYQEQLKALTLRLHETLEKSQLNCSEAIKEIWPCPQPFGYRNRTCFKTDGQVLGYVSADSHSIAPIEDCPILTDDNRITLWKLLETLPREDFKPRKTQSWNTVCIEEGLDLADVVLNSPLPFKQGNSEQNLRMQAWLEQRLSEMALDLPVLELFAGSGNFTAVLSSIGFEKIVAVEGFRPAIRELRRRNLAGVHTVESNLFSNTAVADIAEIISNPSILVLNPPREGLKKKDWLFQRFPTLREVFYISCNEATFARDLLDFCDHGFQITEIQPLDTFPHTPHLEILGQLTKIG